MKKYVKPAVVTITIDSQALMADSFTPKDEVGNGVHLSKGHSFFDTSIDDEEE